MRLVSIQNSKLKIQNLRKDWRDDLVAVDVLVSVLAVLGMRRVRDLADIDHRKKDEDKSLYECDKEPERHDKHGHDPVCNLRREIRDIFRHLFVREHVAEETDAERQRAN